MNFIGVGKRVLTEIGSDIFFSSKTALSSAAASSDATSVTDANDVQRNDSDTDLDDVNGMWHDKNDKQFTCSIMQLI